MSWHINLIKKLLIKVQLSERAQAVQFIDHLYLQLARFVFTHEVEKPRPHSKSLLIAANVIEKAEVDAMHIDDGEDEKDDDDIVQGIDDTETMLAIVQGMYKLFLDCEDNSVSLERFSRKLLSMALVFSKAYYDGADDVANRQFLPLLYLSDPNDILFHSINIETLHHEHASAQDEMLPTIRCLEIVAQFYELRHFETDLNAIYQKALEIHNLKKQIATLKKEFANDVTIRQKIKADKVSVMQQFNHELAMLNQIYKIYLLDDASLESQLVMWHEIYSQELLDKYMKHLADFKRNQFDMAVGTKIAQNEQRIIGIKAEMQALLASIPATLDYILKHISKTQICIDALEAEILLDFNYDLSLNYAYLQEVFKNDSSNSRLFFYEMEKAALLAEIVDVHAFVQEGTPEFIQFFQAIDPENALNNQEPISDMGLPQISYGRFFVERLFSMKYADDLNLQVQLKNN